MRCPLRHAARAQKTLFRLFHKVAQLSDLRSKNSELEERTIQLNKELHAAQEFAKSLDCELKENVAQKEDQVSIITHF
jgi:predicted phage-related endonuclease